MDCGLCDTGDGAEGGNDYVRILGQVGLVHDLVLLDFAVGGLKVVIVECELFGVDVQGVDNAALCGVIAGLPAGAGPRLLLGVNLVVHHLGHLNRLHHLCHDTVSQHQHGNSVLLRLVIGEHQRVDSFLNGGGSVGDEVVVTVAAALGGLEIVTLGGLNAAEAGAAAHNVENYAGELCASAVGDTLLLEADAGAGGRSDDARAGGGCAVNHVYCRNFALGLEEAASNLGHTGGHVLRDFSLRGDRIAEEETRAGTNGGFSDRFATLHKS